MIDAVPEFMWVYHLNYSEQICKILSRSVEKYLGTLTTFQTFHPLFGASSTRLITLLCKTIVKFDDNFPLLYKSSISAEKLRQLEKISLLTWTSRGSHLKPTPVFKGVKPVKCWQTPVFGVGST